MDIIYSFDHYTESWIEVSSQPSTSSLSSANTDDIASAGLQAQHRFNARRRRRSSRNDTQAHIASIRTASVAGSSQEEYEESESESDRVMNSSNEALGLQISHGISSLAPNSSASEAMSSDADEDDGNSTALGVNYVEPVFTPQPNAFSHPPQPSTTRNAPPSESRNSYFPASRETQSRAAAHSFPDQRPRSHTPYNVISPSHQADHDAALRASLSTLLSCAAAARGLPKRDQTAQNVRRPSNRQDPLSLRMVPERELIGQDATGYRVTNRRHSASSTSMHSSHEKGKRKASTSKDRREMRKKRRASADEMTVAPTLMTWVLSAGVVVLFSAISFSAGYALGREVGRVEAGMSPGHRGMGNREIGKGLRRLRWGSTSTIACA